MKCIVIGCVYIKFDSKLLRCHSVSIEEPAAVTCIVEKSCVFAELEKEMEICIICEHIVIWCKDLW